MIVLSRTDRSVLGRWWWTVDRWGVAAISFLVIVGIVLSYAASPGVAVRYDYAQFHFVYRNFLFLVPSLMVLFAVSLLTPRQVRRVAALVFVLALALLVVTPFIGAEIKGARRWIRVGIVSVQASEFVKPAFIVLSAWLFSEQNRDHSIPGNLLAALLYALIIGLLFLQPDFGQIMLLSFTWGAMFFFSGLSWPWMAGLGGLAATGATGAYFYLPHVTSRIDRFFDPSSGDTYQVDRAMDAFQAGGLWGLGPGEGLVKRFIPDAHTDFVFAVAGEEFGLISCLLLAGVFLFFVIRCLSRATAEEDHFIQLTIAGLACLFGFQALINMAVTLSLIPAKGMTLPFISYGGSSLMATSLTVGMLLALTRRRGATALSNEFA